MCLKGVLGVYLLKVWLISKKLCQIHRLGGNLQIDIENPWAPVGAKNLEARGQIINISPPGRQDRQVNRYLYTRVGCEGINHRVFWQEICHASFARQHLSKNIYSDLFLPGQLRFSRLSWRQDGPQIGQSHRLHGSRRPEMFIVGNNCQAQVPLSQPNTESKKQGFGLGLGLKLKLTLKLFQRNLDQDNFN